LGYRILYLARHNSGGNDDEGSIAHALTALGHDVVLIHEPYFSPRRRTIMHPINNAVLRQHADFLLFHHFGDWEAIRRFRMPKVFWYFDCVNYPDPTLHARNAARLEWMRNALEVATVGFCTDGTFAARHPDKLVWLPQGADERVCGTGTSQPIADILFTGIGRGGGRQRESFVAEMRSRYGNRLTHIERGIHRRELANLIAGHKIVVAPDSPVAERYWSNRIYNALGFGAFLLHPYCGVESQNQYRNLQELVYYHNRKHLHELIEVWLDFPVARQQVAANALKGALERHTYRHRVEELIRIVQERL
jgi:hypothetical protein